MKQLLFTLVALLATVGLLGGTKALQIFTLVKASQSMVMPPTSVSTTEVSSQEWEETLTAIGTIEAVQGVMVSADIPGRVTSIGFEAGTSAKAGDALIHQDVSSEEAQLRAALANADLAKAMLERTRELISKKVASAVELDTAEARYKEAIATADNIRTTIAKKTIIAPFDGQLGIRRVNLGQDLASGTPIVSLQAIDALHVNFTLPQRNISDLEPGFSVRVYSDALPGEVFNGTIVAIDPQVDALTRSVKVQAEFDNASRKLLPGMYAKVEVVLPASEPVLAVPRTAIAYATFGDSVFVVEEVQNEQTGELELRANQQFVQLGRSQGDYVAVVKGLSAGQTVVSAGVFKLRSGATVAVNNDEQPEYQIAPALNDA